MQASRLQRSLGWCGVILAASLIVYYLPDLDAGPAVLAAAVVLAPVPVLVRPVAIRRFRVVCRFVGAAWLLAAVLLLFVGAIVFLPSPILLLTAAALPGARRPDTSASVTSVVSDQRS